MYRDGDRVYRDGDQPVSQEEREAHITDLSIMYAGDGPLPGRE